MFVFEAYLKTGKKFNIVADIWIPSGFDKIAFLFNGVEVMELNIYDISCMRRRKL